MTEAMIKMIDTLPAVFQERIHAFQDFNPEVFNKNFLSYETRTCKAAVIISEKYPSPAEIATFGELPLEEKEAVPELGVLNLSGNQMAFAITLADIYLEHDDEYLVGMHGAMCFAAGCEKYGCHSVRRGALTEKYLRKVFAENHISEEVLAGSLLIWDQIQRLRVWEPPTNVVVSDEGNVNFAWKIGKNWLEIDVDADGPGFAEVYFLDICGDERVQGLLDNAVLERKVDVSQTMAWGLAKDLCQLFTVMGHK